MKTFLNILWRMVCHFSIAFSGIILFFWSLMRDSGYIDHDKIKVFFFFSLIFGVSSIFFSIPKAPYFAKVALHFVVNTIGFLSTFVSVDGMTQVRSFVAGTVFVIIYVLVSLVIFGFTRLINKASKKSEE